MDLQQAKILIEKVNSLYKSIDLDRGQIAPIERDLMLNYLRQLYELFLKADGSVASSQNIPSTEETEASLSNRPHPEPLKRTYQPPRIIEIPDTSQEKISTPSSQPVKSDAPRPKPEPQNQKAPDPVQAQHKVEDLPEIEALFEQKQATELSEKLSESPVHDLTKAIAINDRLLYMNELFGKNMSTLDQALQQLNRYDNMEAAKPLLHNLASRFDWTQEEKIDTAKTFIKLVRRRYAH